MSKILDSVIETTKTYIETMPKAERKKYGQFFTSVETAEFMASLFGIPKNKTVITVLDAGAGTGILSAAMINHLQQYSWLEKIELTCYETDGQVLDLLHDNLQAVKNNSKISVEYTVVTENYILSQQSDYNEMLGLKANPQKFDYVIGNPPYMKIPKDAPEAKAMPNVCYGAPNTYFLFAAMGLFNLQEDGELVYIIPRSWTSGAYFKSFRQYFMTNGVLEHLHLFVSRDKVFDKECVLQETMIVKVKKSKIKPSCITITSTKTNKDFKDVTFFKAPYDVVVSGGDYYVYLVTDTKEVEILEELNKWQDTLPSIGLKMKTGLTVDFRNRDVLRNQPMQDTVPLFYSQHIKDGKVIFPVGKENEYISTQQRGLLQQNRNYLFVKRFTAKEEQRRLQCGVYLSKRHPEYEVISTQNKINFIDSARELSECAIYGLYVLFNSTIYDYYYRILNGSTQVNSTEINSMPVPPLNIIESMGREIIIKKDWSEGCCDQILRSYL